MGEVCTEDRDDTVAYLGDGSDALHLSFYLDFAMVKWSAERFRESVGWLEAHIPADGWPCYYLNNHDLSRTFTRLGGGRHAEARAKVAAAMLLTLQRHPHHLRRRGDRDADEQGAAGRDEGPPRHEVLAAFAGQGRRPHAHAVERREERRLQLRASRGSPWIRRTPRGTWSTRTAIRARCSTGTGRLIRLRASRPALSIGSYRVIEDAPRGVYAYVRESEGEKVAVLLNFTSRPITVRFGPDELAGEVLTTLLSSQGDGSGSGGRRPLHLRPLEILIVEIGASS